MEQAFVRLNKVIEYLRDKGKIHKQQDIVDALGMSKPNVSRALNAAPRYFTMGFLKRFASAYSDYINEDWLLTGKGKMEKVDKRRLRPHIPASFATVAAGFVGSSIGSVAEDDCDMFPVISYLPNYDFVITVNGDSMEPILQNNDKIACVWVDSSEYINPDKIYVVDSNDGAVVKKIIPYEDDIICLSLNPRYEDYSISKTDILRLARVVGVVREL